MLASLGRISIMFMSSASAPWASLAMLFFCTKTTHGVAVPVPVNSSVVSVTSSNLPSTITPAPNLPVSEQAIPINTCSYYNSTISQYQWNDPWCSIQAGTVQLSYWPTGDNYSYPATVYNSKLDYTFTSPSVYMIVNTIYGWNPCGPLGPTTTDAIFAFDLTDVSTLVPYTDVSATTRRYTRQLHLSDLGLDCPTVIDTSSLATNTHPMRNDDVRCNPALIIPPQIKYVGLPYWNHCGNVGNKFGLFDPPYAMPTLAGLFPVTMATTSSTIDPPVETQPPAVTGPTAVPDLPSSTGVFPQATETTATREPSPKTAAASEASPGTTPEVAPSVYAMLEVSSAVVTTVSKQIVSLGSAGFEVNTEGGATSTYAVPAIGATEPGLCVAPGSTLVYQGQTLTVGGAAATVTGAVVVVPTGSGAGIEGLTGGGSAISSISTPALFTGSADKVLGSMVCVGVGFLVAIWLL